MAVACQDDHDVGRLQLILDNEKVSQSIQNGAIPHNDGDEE